MFDYPYTHPRGMAGENLLRKAVGMMLRETLSHIERRIW